MHTLGLGSADSNRSLSIDTPLGTSVVPSQLCGEGILHIDGHQFYCDLIVSDMRLFYIILGMDWLTLHAARIDCESRKISLYREPEVVVTFWVDRKLPFFLSDTRKDPLSVLLAKLTLADTGRSSTTTRDRVQY